MTNAGSAVDNGERRNRKRKQSTDKQQPPAKKAPAPAPAAASARKRRMDHDSSKLAPAKLAPVAEECVAGVALTFGSGDTGQLGLGEDVLERKKPSVVQCIAVGFIQVGCEYFGRSCSLLFCICHFLSFCLRC